MGLCIAPCCTNDESRYNEIRWKCKQLNFILQNKDDSVIKYYENKMNEYIKIWILKVQLLKERIKNLKKFCKIKLEFTKEYDEDYFCI